MTGSLNVGSDGSAAAGLGLSAAGPIVSTVTGSPNITNLACNRRGTPASDAGSAFVKFTRQASATGNSSTDVTIGTITINTGGSSVLYNTTSDYRLKDVIGDVTDPLARVAALQPRRLRWKGSDVEFDGFLAHEVADVVPAAVTGAKDAMLPDDEGGGIDPQQLDVSALVPILVAAVQALTAEVAELRAAAR